jgi:hypothetical protein
LSFRVAHPFHPLFGQEFGLVVYRHNWGEDRVYFHDRNGALCSIPASWTSADAPDPFVVIAAGRSPFRYEDLARLADIIASMRREQIKDV